MMQQQRLRTIEWDGRPISKPGMYGKLSLARYHLPGVCIGPSVSSGGLRMVASRSPAHFFDTWPENPQRKERKDTAALILGRATHHLLLGELFFSKLFAVQPVEYVSDKGEVKPWHNGANACKDWQADRKREGRAVLTVEDAENIRGMAYSLSLHPMVIGTGRRDGILNGLIERSLVWQDKATGLWCKARPDAIPTDSGDFVDLKTTRSVLWMDLQRSIFDYGYYAQAAFIRMGAREVLGLDRITFTLVFVENESPYCTEIVSLKDNDLDLGEREIRRALDTVARCLKSGHWPGPGGEHSDARPIEISEQARQRAEDRLKYADT